MIPIACPRCDRVYSVPPDRLNAKMHCKACDATFYMDSGGRLVLGDPNKKGKQSRSYQPASFGFGEFGEKYAGTLKKALPYVIGFVLIFFIGRWVLGLKGSGPRSIEDYGTILGQAAIKNDVGTFKSYSTPDTVGDAPSLLEKIRAGLKPTSNLENTQMIVSPGALDTTPTPGISVVDVLFIAQEDISDLSAKSSTTQKVPPFSISFQMKEDANGKFLLEAKKTLEVMARKAGM